MSNESLIVEASHYLSMEEDDLLAALVPDDQRLFGPGAIVSRGRQIFVAAFERVKDKVCPVYQQHAGMVEGSLELTVLLVPVLVSTPALDPIPVLPFAALLVKMGLGELCNA
jgi:hypothetical protein